MKTKIAFCAMAIVMTSLIAAYAGGKEVYSNIVGVQLLSLLPGHNFVGLNFKNVDGGDSFDVQALFATAPLTGGETRADADRLVLWDAEAQEYVELWLFDSGGAHPDFDGKWIDRATGDVAGPERVISAGAAVWAVKQTADELVETRPF